MPKALRTAVLACAALVSLAFAGTAMAAFTPRLVVSHQSYAFGSSAQTTISLTANAEDNSIAKISIYSPVGYSATLNQAVGTQIGTVHARAQARAISPDAILTIDGVVRVADQNDATLRQQAIGCTGSPTHEAAWVLALQAAGTPLNIPVFVDSTSGAEAAFSSYKLQICLTSPEIPQSAGGAPFGAKVLEATMALNGVFSNPTSRGQYIWRALFTPYVPNTGTANPAGTVETRSIVAIPTSVSLTAKYLKKKNTFQLTGAVKQASATATLVGIGGLRVVIYRGSSVSKLKSVSSTRTKANGTFKTAGHLKPRKTTYFQVRVSRAVQDDRVGVCAAAGGQSLAPGGCVSGTRAPFDIRSRVVKIRIKR